MSKAHQPPHRNKKTGEWLRNQEQVCPACYENFANTKSGDKHRIGEFGVDRRCAYPPEVGLIASKNKFGTLVWRINDGHRTW